MPVLAAMRKREARRVVKSIRRSVHDLGDHRQRAHGARANAWNEEQFGEVGRPSIRRGCQVGVKARLQHVAWADVVMGRHDQMPQKELLRHVRRSRLSSPVLQNRQFARDPIRTQRLQNTELTAAGRFGAAIGWRRVVLQQSFSRPSESQ
jgi:hypothetical protein